MYQYQKTNRYFAQVADDIKDLAANELTSLGATEISPVYRGLYFNASAEAMYRINFCSRLIHRVLAPLLTFDCHSDRYLYKTASNIAWSDFLNADQTFAVFAGVSNSAIRHSQYAALKLKDAIVDQFRDRNGRRPSVDTEAPDVWINLYIINNKATVSIDTSGGSLHKRGYRKRSVQAPMIETLAASIIDMSGWDEQTPLYDPFCGSGTILCEAYLKATRTPPSIMRRSFGFEKLPNFDALAWRRVKQQTLKDIAPISGNLIAGSDIDAEAVDAARENCSILNKTQPIAIEQRDIFDIDNLENSTLVCNPPYGIRLDTNADLPEFYKQVGDFLKQRCNGTNAFIYFGDRNLIKYIRLKPAWKKQLANGGLDGRLVKYEMY
ncbi:class I SAM-dependent RNA methyltransferase [candidate division KSB1 bacterium]|nr:class I SAM-dependent RNA methyltransferase [candidate division KSB1 bacterium]